MLKLFKIIGFLEGVSYLVLFFNMLVIKNISMEWYKIFLFPIGLAHGLLFISYIVLAIVLKMEQNWSVKKFALICLASILPFGTFYSEKHWLPKVF